MEESAWPYPILPSRLDEHAKEIGLQAALNSMTNSEVSRFWRRSETYQQEVALRAIDKSAKREAAELANLFPVHLNLEQSRGTVALRWLATIFLGPEPAEQTSDFVYVCDRFRAALCETQGQSWPLIVSWGHKDRNQAITPQDYEALWKTGPAAWLGESQNRPDAIMAAFHLSVHGPKAAAYIAEVKDKSAFLAGWLTAMAYLSIQQKQGRKFRGPEAGTAARVWTEGLRTACSLSENHARRVWNSWFPERAFGFDETAKSQLRRERRDVIAVMRRMFGQDFDRLTRGDQKTVDLSNESPGMTSCWPMRFDNAGGEPFDVILSAQDCLRIDGILKKQGAVTTVTDLKSGRPLLIRCIPCELPNCNCDVSAEPVREEPAAE